MDELKLKTAESLVERFSRFGVEGWFKFMRDELKYVPDKCFEPVVASLASYKDTAVKSCHGTGKTADGACVMLTAEALVPNLICLQISPTWMQVVEVFWNEVRKWWANSNALPVIFDMAEKAPRMVSNLSPEGWYARGVASNKPGHIEGRHGSNLLLLIDEMKAVEDGIVEASQGALTSVGQGVKVWRGYFSTPSTPGGKYSMFYKAFTKHRDRWKCFTIKAADSPRVSQEWVDRMIADFGAESQIVKARVYGEFPEASENSLLSLSEAERFYDSEAIPQGQVAFGIDVARYGSDESVISVYTGPTLTSMMQMRKTSTMTLGQHALEEIDRQGAKVIVVDDVGVGGGVTDFLSSKLQHRTDISVIPFTANSRPQEPEKFVSASDEILWLFAKAVREKRTRSKIQDEILEGQLSTYQVTYTKDNRIQVRWPGRASDRSASDSKSPDRADSCVMAWWGSTLLSGSISDAVSKGREEELERDLRPMGRGMISRGF